jgi:hypothetical protein
MPSRVEPRIHHLDDVLARDRRADARLLLEALAEPRVVRERRVHHLERALEQRLDVVAT